MYSETKNLMIRIGILAAIIVGSYFILLILFKYAGPFLLALVVTLLLDPLVNLLNCKLRLPRSISTLVAMIMTLIVIGLLLFLGISAIVSEIRGLLYTLPSFYADVQNWFYSLIDDIRQWYGALPPQTLDMVNETMSRLYQGLANILNQVMNWVVQFFNVLPSATLFIIFTVLAAYLMSKDKPVIGQAISNVLPVHWRDQIFRLQSDVLSTSWKLLWTQVMLIAITTGITITGLFILGVKYAVVLGIISGLLDILPVVGPTLLFIPWIIYCFFTGQIWLGIGLALLYTVMSVLRQVLQAKLISENINLHPLATLLSLYVGMKLFGFIGVILGPLIALIIAQAIKNGLFEVKKV